MHSLPEYLNLTGFVNENTSSGVQQLFDSNKGLVKVTSLLDSTGLKSRDLIFNS